MRCIASRPTRATSSASGKKPLAAYLDIEDILRIARQARVDAIHPGYGFLSENPDFAQAVHRCRHPLRSGRRREVMRILGNKVAARNAAVAAGLPVMPATGPLPHDLAQCQATGGRARLPGDAQGELGRRRARHAHHRTASRTSKRPCRRRAARQRPPSATTRSTSRSSCSARVTSRCRSSATPTARRCTCSSATARCSGATRRSSSALPRRISTRRSARSCATARSPSPARSATRTPARSSS